jgi:NADP-reducing hydrogenase subunit HndA
MKKKLTTVDFHGTKEQEEKLLAVIEKHAGQKGAMMPILQRAQEIYGYLPLEVQEIIAQKTGVSLEEIFGIVSFLEKSDDNLESKVRKYSARCFLRLFDDFFINIEQYFYYPG